LPQLGCARQSFAANRGQVFSLNRFFSLLERFRQPLRNSASIVADQAHDSGKA
jgi:hypothetical protein